MPSGGGLPHKFTGLGLGTPGYSLGGGGGQLGLGDDADVTDAVVHALAAAEAEAHAAVFGPLATLGASFETLQVGAAGGLAKVLKPLRLAGCGGRACLVLLLLERQPWQQ